MNYGLTHRPAAYALGWLSEHESMTGIDQAKQAIRERVWSRLESTGTVEPGVRGYIPAFHGADQAAERLADLRVWHSAQVLKVVPDRAQFPVRVRALEAGKLVYMAVPRLAEAEPFYLLDPDQPDGPASRSRGRGWWPLRVASHGRRQRDAALWTSSSAAAWPSTSTGPGWARELGYSDIEVGLLAEAGLLGERTVDSDHQCMSCRCSMRRYPSRPTTSGST